MGRQIKKYKGLFRKFGFKISFYEFSLRVVGIKFRNSSLWKKIYKKKYLEINRYICKTYQSNIHKWELKTYTKNDFKPIKGDCNIYVYWAHGFEKAPAIVCACLAQLKKIANEHPVIELNDDNIGKYVQIPDRILKKYEKKMISTTMFSDIIRTNLLAQQGGIWIDSTVWISNNLNSIKDYSFYTIRHGLYEDYHICRGKWSSFFMASGKENAYMSYVADMLNCYWNNEDTLIDYLLIDCMLGIGYDHIAEFRKLVDNVPVNNSRVFELMERLISGDEEFDYDELLLSNNYHKLTYKIDIKNELPNKIFGIKN